MVEIVPLNEKDLRVLAAMTSEQKRVIARLVKSAIRAGQDDAIDEVLKIFDEECAAAKREPTGRRRPS